MHIRAEQEKDYGDVRSVNIAAFETSSEANLVDALREQAKPVVSLVAEDDGTVVGHIMFSPISLANHAGLNLAGLAPMAVIPNRQRAGIGTALVRAGLEQCKLLGCIAIVVLGHPEFYTRFGFSPSSRFGISSEYDVPDDVFMAMELRPNSLKGLSGKVKYHAAFGNV